MKYRYLLDDGHIRTYENVELWDLNDPVEREIVACEIAREVLNWHPNTKWPIDMKILDENDNILFTASVDMYYEPQFEAYIDD